MERIQPQKDSWLYETLRNWAVMPRITAISRVISFNPDMTSRYHNFLIFDLGLVFRIISEAFHIYWLIRDILIGNRVNGYVSIGRFLCQDQITFESYNPFANQLLGKIGVFSDYYIASRDSPKTGGYAIGDKDVVWVKGRFHGTSTALNFKIWKEWKLFMRV